MVRLVENEQATGKHRPQPLAHRVGVRGVNQKVVRDQETAMGTPGVHTEATFAPHPCEVCAIENLEHKTEAVFQLALPLLKHGRRRGDHDGLSLLAKQQLTRDETSLNRL